MKNLPYEDALLGFRLRADMVDSVRCHWKNQSSHVEELWRCWHPGCNMADQTSHIIQCSGYADLKEDLTISEDEGLVEFVRRVIQRRKESSDS